MASLNKKATPELFTHEGAPAKRLSVEQELRRTIMACMLWEDTFYEAGEEVGDRIKNLVRRVNPVEVAKMAIEAREKQHLRHAPLLLARELARTGYVFTGQVIERIIQRPDELSEFLSIYWRDGRCSLSAQVKKGLARAFLKFNEYQFAKYNRPKEIRLRDVMFLTHPKPDTSEKEELFKKIADDTLSTPDTWEVNLSGGKDKKETFIRLIKEHKLGGLAMLRNLRNMIEANVPNDVIIEGLKNANYSRVLPFRFISALKYAPQFEPDLEELFLYRARHMPELKGRTVVLVDVSGSMCSNLSAKSDMKRMDAACALAAILREMCEIVSVYTFSDYTIQVPLARSGFALIDAIKYSQHHSRTNLGGAIQSVYKSEIPDRLIIITDEQSSTLPTGPKSRGYCINVGSYKRGLLYGKWVHIDGWSEGVINWLSEYERFTL